jgi:hypothetical protein
MFQCKYVARHAELNFATDNKTLSALLFYIEAGVYRTPPRRSADRGQWALLKMCMGNIRRRILKRS